MIVVNAWSGRPAGSLTEQRRYAEHLENARSDESGRSVALAPRARTSAWTSREDEASTLNKEPFEGASGEQQTEQLARAGRRAVLASTSTEWCLPGRAARVRSTAR